MVTLKELYEPNYQRWLKYFTYFMIFFACFLVFVLLLTAFMEDGPDAEAKERHKWCEEHHPNLTFEECSNEAGW
jgi:hypothetical protein